ncbi:tRNA(Met) cytidine acetate ligase [Lawsonibacter sp. LCP25S3_F5]
MNIAGITAEYNPFHTGHAYQISALKAQLGPDTSVVAVMSGSWVQQGRPAVTDKWTRARMALNGGADLILELPTVWAAASAESFARGAVELLCRCGVIDTLCFGSETGELAPLLAAAECLDSPDYPEQLRKALEGGASFAAARQAAVEALIGPAGAALASPNNNLGVEYLRALRSLHSNIKPVTIRREGAAHNSLDRTGEGFRSATQLRQHLARGEWEAVRPYVPAGNLDILQSAPLADPRLGERAVLACLRKMTAEDWARLPDAGAGEGLPQRLERAGRQCQSLDDFFTQAKTRRYAMARLRRMALWAFLGLTAADVPAEPPYLRVLGFNARGREVLKQMKTTAQLPILTKPAHARELDGPGRRLFELEARCTDLYGLFLPQLPPPGQEWTRGPIINID